MNQIDYISGPDSTILVDYVGRFETLYDSLTVMVEQAKLDKSILSNLPHDRHNSSHGPYAQYYDDKLAEEVAILYRKDIKAFGYKFE